MCATQLKKKCCFDDFTFRLLAEVGQLSRVDQESSPFTEQVYGARASPLEQGRAVLRIAVLSVLGVLHHRHLRTGDTHPSMHMC